MPYRSRSIRIRSNVRWFSTSGSGCTFAGHRALMSSEGNPIAFRLDVDDGAARVAPDGAPAPALRPIAQYMRASPDPPPFDGDGILVVPGPADMDLAGTARPCRRIAPATACGTRKSGTGETFISSREEIPVAAWRSAWWHFMAGLPPPVLGSISSSSGVLLSCCMLVFSLHQDSARRMHHSREPLVKRVSQWP